MRQECDGKERSRVIKGEISSELAQFLSGINMRSTNAFREHSVSNYLHAHDSVKHRGIVDGVEEGVGVLGVTQGNKLGALIRGCDPTGRLVADEATLACKRGVFALFRGL